MELRDIEYFAVVARHGHVGRAADSLEMSQSALSKSLRRIENSIGAKIVKRTPKGVDLTSVGTALLSHVRRLQVAKDDVAREVADLVRGHAGHLRIGASNGFAEELAGRAGGLLLKEAPKVKLNVKVVTTDGLLAALRNGEFDLAIGAIPASPSADLVHEPLLADEYAVYAPTSHPLAKRSRLTLADLARERWVKSAANGFSWQQLRLAFEKCGLPPPQIAVESDSRAVRLHAMVAAGLLHFSSRPVVKQDARLFRITELRVKEMSWNRRTDISYRKDAYLSPATQRFIEILKAVAKEIAAK